MSWTTKTVTDLSLDLQSLLLNDQLASQIAFVETLPAREAQYAEARSPLPARLAERLGEQGISQLFTHQAEAYEAAMRGEDVVVTTGTNSGKTLCYNLPALTWGINEPAARMLYLFPTKALAQDQMGRLEALSKGLGVRVGVYDGDTPPNQRALIRRLAHIVLTNPDMLHVGILPGHELWSKSLKALRLIVIDEMHVYRGVFGSHVGGVLRRLLRLCEWHHARPQIIACSATIGNAREVFQRLTGRTPRVIVGEGAPQGSRTFVFWNPPPVGEGQRLSGNVVASEILATLAERRLRTLVFNRARVSAELVLRYTRRRLQSTGGTPPEAVESYRAGYTPKERREIEQALFKGNLLGLSATNAMELGVDVGGLDAVVMNGYPGTIASFQQQSGRAGRGTRDSVVIFVAHDDPLEQFLLREPQRILHGTPEHVSLNPQNPLILRQQLLCAAHERALSPTELEKFGPGALELVESMDRSGELRFQGGRFFYPSHEPPAMNVNIRGTGGDQVTLVLDGQVLGTMERWRAMGAAHTGAVYLHRGESFLVINLDLEANRAEMIPAEPGYYTRPNAQSIIEPQVTLGSRRIGDGDATLAGVKVTSIISGFQKRSLDGDAVLGVEELELPPSTVETLAVQFDLPEVAEEELAGQMAAIHGLEHALMAVAPLIAGCDRGDLGSAWYAVFPDTMAPAVFVYDPVPGGVGLCERLYESVGAWLEAARQLLAGCECEEGCPGCLMSPRCESGNNPLDKQATLKLMQRLRPGE